MAEPQWRRRYEQLAGGSGYLNDLGNEVLRAEGLTGPRDTLMMAASAATAAEGLALALQEEWALYTPQEAAAVTAALQVTLTQTMANLQFLTVAVGQIAARGDLGLASGAGAGLADILRELAVKGSGQTATAQDVASATRALAAAPLSRRLPRTVHENMITIGERIGSPAELTTLAGHHHPEATAYGCGCTLRIRGGSQLYYLAYGDSHWSLFAEDASQADACGRRFWDDAHVIDLDLLDPLAHPGQIVQAVEEALQASS